MTLYLVLNANLKQIIMNWKNAKKNYTQNDSGGGGGDSIGLPSGKTLNGL